MGQGTARGPAGGPALIGVAVLAGTAGVWSASRSLLRAPDPFWHLELGRRIVRARTLPREDLFSFLTADQDWVLNQWGTDLLIGLLDRAGGLWLVSLAAALLVATAIGVAGHEMWRRSPSLSTVALLGLVVLATMPNWLLRGNLLSFIVLPLVLRELRRDRPRLPALGLLMAFWANVHGGFLLGVALVFIDAVGRVPVAAPGRRSAVARHSTLAVIVALICTLLTPFGPKFLGSSLTVAIRGTSAPVSEWGPASLTDPQVLPYTILVAVVLVSIGVVSCRDDLPAVLNIVAGTLFGMTASRNIAPAAIIVGVLGAPYVHAAGRALLGSTAVGDGRPAKPFDRWTAAAIVGASAVVMAVLVPRPSTVMAHASGIPLAIIDDLRTLDGPARVATPSIWAPAVSTLTGEHVRTEVDARVELFTDAQFQQHLALHRGAAGWDDTLDEWCVSDAVVPVDDPLHGLLAGHDDWGLVTTASVHRAPGEQAAWFRREAQASPCEDPTD